MRKYLVLAAPLLAAAACGLDQIPRGPGARDAGPMPVAPGAPVADAGSPPAGDSPRPDANTRPPPNQPPPVPRDAAAPAAPDAPVVVGGDVVIGGRPLSRDQVIVFLHLGHSNMAGRTDVPAELRPLYFQTHPQLWGYAKGGVWSPAKEPLSGDYLTRGKAGPGMAILHTGLSHAPALYMVSIGHGHDGSIGGWCRNYRKGALLYDFVMGPAMELKGKVTFGAIFTMLGVNEFRRDRVNIPHFAECLAGIASDMRGDLGDPNIPFLMGDWEAGAKGDFDPTHDYAIATKAQLRMAAETIPRAGLIPSDGLPMSDDHHYDLQGYKMWVERGFGLLQEKQLIPWATADR